jgi:hypothetical protein
MPCLDSFTQGPLNQGQHRLGGALTEDDKCVAVFTVQTVNPS